MKFDDSATDLDPDRIDELSDAFGGLINTRLSKGLTEHEVMASCIETVVCALARIECRDCRELARKYIKKLLAKGLSLAMKEPAGESYHLH